MASPLQAQPHTLRSSTATALLKEQSSFVAQVQANLEQLSSDLAAVLAAQKALATATAGLLHFPGRGQQPGRIGTGHHVF